MIFQSILLFEIVTFFIERRVIKQMYRILDVLQQSEDFVSGQEIGNMLCVSRAAVWKGIEKLRQEGYEIEAVTNKGYRLIHPETMYNKRELEAGRKTKRMGYPVHFWKETDSTNNRLRELAFDGAKEGTLAVAEVQTAGRGRRGKPWCSPVGTGIWLSVLLRPSIAPAQASVLTLLGGLAVCEVLENMTELKPQIKWPNDIYIGNKKAVGILTEMDCELTEVHFVVMGIGINVNTKEFPDDLQDIATSLYLESGQTYSRKKLVQNIMEVLERYYDAFVEAGTFVPFLEQYRKKCMTLGKEVTVFCKEPFSAAALDITEDGELLVRRADNGKKEVVYAGEVSIRGVIK